MNYIKQYGAERTGTNAVRYILTNHLRDVTVLMHVLGDKHSRPSSGLDTSRNRCTSPLEWAVTATLENPSATTDLESADQRLWIQQHATDAYEAYFAGKLAFVLTVRDPYVWLSSLARFRGRLSPDYSATSAMQSWVEEQCCKLNERISAWLLYLSQQEHAAIIRYELLAYENLAKLVSSLVKDLGLEAEDNIPDRVPGYVMTSHWDDSHSTLRSDLQINAASVLPTDLVHVVTETIDWDLMSVLEYYPRPAL